MSYVCVRLRLTAAFSFALRRSTLPLRSAFRLCLAFAPFPLLTLAVPAQTPRANISTPKGSIGVNMGDDYMLAH